jgi:negative regulator of flagellin synthesis FlgM
MPDPVQGVNAADGLSVKPTDGPGSGQAAGPATQPQAAPATDSANVTQVEALLQTIGTLASNVPNVNQERIAEIRAAIAAGTYQINPQAIAEKMLEIERLLSGGQGS